MILAPLLGALVVAVAGSPLDDSSGAAFVPVPQIRRARALSQSRPPRTRFKPTLVSIDRFKH
jgi:hypothetical protein